MHKMCHIISLMLTKVFQRTEKVIACLLVFLIPTQLALHFWPSYSFVYGIRVDYLSPSIYLTDFLIFCLLILWFVNDKKTLFNFFKNSRQTILIFFLFVFVNLFFSTSVWVSFWKWIKIIELILLAVYFYFRKHFVEERNFYNSLLVSAALFSLIGITQFFLGKTTGLFYFLGERSFSLATPGIALVKIFGREFMRAYSTFSHPNSLAGFLGVVILLSIYEKVMWKKKLVPIAICLFCFLLTFSLSSTITLVAVVLLLKIFTRKKIERKMVLVFWTLSLTLSLLLPLMSRDFYTWFNFLGKRYTERIDLAFVSGEMISSRFFQGSGLNTFIVNTPKFKGVSRYSWILQPVHNSLLLIFSEIGVVGVTVYFLSFMKLLKTKYALIFLFILITGMFDHYWLTLQQNLLLTSFLVGLSLKRLKM